MRRLALPLALLALSALPAFAADATAAGQNDVDGPTKLSPLQIGQIFCLTRVGNDMAPIEAIITASLKKAIDTADGLEAKWEKKNPNEAPPLGDGLPWQGSTDYTTNCTASAPVVTDKDAKVSISYVFADDAAANYTDTLVLKPVPDKEIGDNVWRVDDVVFSDKHDMRQELVDAFK